VLEERYAAAGNMLSMLVRSMCAQYPVHNGGNGNESRMMRTIIMMLLVAHGKARTRLLRDTAPRVAPQTSRHVPSVHVCIQSAALHKNTRATLPH
jgi:hypothetical protein